MREPKERLGCQEAGQVHSPIEAPASEQRALVRLAFYAMGLASRSSIVVRRKLIDSPLRGMLARVVLDSPLLPVR